MPSDVEPSKEEKPPPSGGGVWVLAEQRGGQLQEVSLELVSEGRRLADKLGEQLGAVVVGSDIAGLAPPLVHLGADMVWLLDSPSLAAYCPELYTDALVQLIEANRPAMVLAGDTSISQDLAPRLAARLKTGLVTECTALSLDEEGLLSQTKPSYGGKASSNVVCPEARPQIATVKPGIMDMGVPDSSRTAEVVKITPQFSGELKTRVVDFIKADPKTVSLGEAELIVAGGGGAGSAENWQLIEELAEALGASLAATRVAVDAGWITSDRQIGQTGKTVSPRLYIACGISGAIQHTMGMKDSKLIIAINKDRNAPIFKLADVKVIGDVVEIVPAITHRLSELAKSSQDSQGVG